MTILDDFIQILTKIDYQRISIVKEVFVDYEIQAIEDAEELAESYIKLNSNTLNHEEYIKDLDKIIRREQIIINGLNQDSYCVQIKKIPQFYLDSFWYCDNYSCEQDCLDIKESLMKELDIATILTESLQFLHLSHCILSSAKRIKAILQFVNDDGTSTISYFKKMIISNSKHADSNFIHFYNNLKQEGAIDTSHTTLEVLRYYFMEGNAKSPTQKITWNASQIDLAVMLHELTYDSRVEWKTVEKVFSNVNADSLKNAFSRLLKSQQQFRDKRKEVINKYLSNIY